MAKSVADIISDAQEDVADSGLGRVIRGTLIGGPLATLGYAFAYGIESLQSMFTNPIQSLGTGSSDIILGFTGGIELLLDAGSGASATALAEYGVVAWLVAIGLIIGGIYLLGQAFDRMDIDTFTGINIPFVSRYSGADEEE